MYQIDDWYDEMRDEHYDRSSDHSSDDSSVNSNFAQDIHLNEHENMYPYSDDNSVNSNFAEDIYLNENKNRYNHSDDHSIYTHRIEFTVLHSTEIKKVIINEEYQRFNKWKNWKKEHNYFQEAFCLYYDDYSYFWVIYAKAKFDVVCSKCGVGCYGNWYCGGSERKIKCCSDNVLISPILIKNKHNVLCLFDAFVRTSKNNKEFKIQLRLLRSLYSFLSITVNDDSVNNIFSFI